MESERGSETLLNTASNTLYSSNPKAHLDSKQIETLIAQYQSNRDVATLASIVDLTQDRAMTLIRFYRTTRYRSQDELLSDVNFKLIRAIDKFDPAKGSAFTFVSQVIANVLFTSVANARKDLDRYRKLTKRVVSNLVDKSEDRTAVDDITHRLKAVAKTTLTDPSELSMQRWYIESFTADGFESRRHECANAAMAVYGLSHSRSRELYDLTMLEVRRVLYDDLKGRQPIPAGRLLGSRLAWIVRYWPLLSESEFTKFVVLVRDLGPFVVVLIDPESRSRRRDRNPAIGRKNLEWIINGHPNAVRLFK